MHPHEFCYDFKISKYGDNRNQTTKGSSKTVIYFYPLPLISPESNLYTEYCKYALTKYLPLEK